MQEPERSCYDLTAFRQLVLPEVHNVSPATFIKTARHEVVLNKRGETGSREKLLETQATNRLERRGNGH